jgi:hypothetical protein
MMDKKREAVNSHLDFLDIDADDDYLDPKKFKTYNEFVAANIKSFPEHLIILLPYEGGENALHVLQVVWMRDFWKGQKNLTV